MKCEICDNELPEIYFELPWEDQRGFHEFYCVRCKRCLCEAEAAPGLPGWCRYHWDTRTADAVPGDYRPRSAKTKRRMRHQRLLEIYNAHERNAPSPPDTEATVRTILDVVAHREAADRRFKP